MVDPSGYDQSKSTVLNVYHIFFKTTTTSSMTTASQCPKTIISSRITGTINSSIRTLTSNKISSTNSKKFLKSNHIR